MKTSKEFTPKLFSILKQGVSKETLIKDSLLGIIVGIVALPLALHLPLLLVFLQKKA